MEKKYELALDKLFKFNEPTIGKFAEYAGFWGLDLLELIKKYIERKSWEFENK